MLFGDGLTLSDVAIVEQRLDDLLLPWQMDVSARNRVSSPAFLKQVDTYGKTIFSR